MAVTTAVWSSDDGKGDTNQPQSAYTRAFVTTTVFASLALPFVPFIRIERQGKSRFRRSDPESSKILEDTPNPPSPSLSPLRLPVEYEKNLDMEKERESEQESIKSKENHPSKRWSLKNTVSMMTNERKSTVAPSVSSASSKRSMDTHRSDNTARTAIQRGRCPSEKVVWVVCEECGTSKRHTETLHAVGSDPARYFNDPTCGGTPYAVKDQHRHPPMRRCPPKPPVSPVNEIPHEHLAQPKPMGGRRRLPLANREMLTHQILTQGFQP
ncbi:hypothetical protein F5Y15DRAFT_16001 [Xylariaceae sp. FL0016]|nr:hypothetical protein F5Y15DRAFT_16001 [Xylariaceae sp. FL0016]